MPDIQKILVATDFSECSRSAMRMAVQIAAAFEASVELLHVWQIPLSLSPDAMINVPGAEGRSLAMYVEQGAAEEMEKVAVELEQLGLSADRISTRIERGDNTDLGILHVAESEKFDLIVLGTHGRTGLSHALLGSVAEKVVRRAKCAVLTVRVDAKAT